MSELVGDELHKHMELCKCLAEAIKEYGRNGDAVTVSSLGSHYKVHELKKDPVFNNMRLCDILEAHPEWFVVVRCDELPSKWHADLSGGAADVLGALDEDEQPGAEVLPAPLDEPQSRDEALQAIRIEVIRSLHKRGGTAQMNDIGQEPHINRHRQQWLKDTRFLDLIQKFPGNFVVEAQGHGNFLVELISMDCNESVSPGPLPKKRENLRDREKGKGKGLAKGKVDGKSRSKVAGKGKPFMQVGTNPSAPRQCTGCGHFPGDGNFCTHCGLAIPKPVNLCHACGEDPGNGNFCTNCGTMTPKGTAAAQMCCPSCGVHPGNGNFCNNCGAVTRKGDSKGLMSPNGMMQQIQLAHSLANWALAPETPSNGVSGKSQGKNSRSKGKGRSKKS
jgi:hypothetical protein